jgi:hypothetical protein
MLINRTGYKKNQYLAGKIFYLERILKNINLKKAIFLNPFWVTCLILILSFSQITSCPPMYPINSPLLDIDGPDYYQKQPQFWLKGNIHSHTVFGDGDAHPGNVVRWYRSHGYDFIAITEHNWMSRYSRILPPNSSFFIIEGRENSGFSPVTGFHILTLGSSIPLHRKMKKYKGSSRNKILKKAQKIGKKAGAVVILNHPHFARAWNRKNILTVPDNYHLEIYNANPRVKATDGPDGLTDEDYWDILLASGKKIYGTACDDAHAYRENSPLKYWSRPGGGFIMVAIYKQLPTKKLKKVTIRAIANGNFYNSSGLYIRTIEGLKNHIKIVNYASEGEIRTELIGHRGKVIYSTDANPALIPISNTDEFINFYSKYFLRIRQQDLKSGKKAWLQPFRLRNEL